MRNGGWIHLENHLKKLLEGIFFIKISISINKERNRESLEDACYSLVTLIDRSGGEPGSGLQDSYRLSFYFVQIQF